MGHYANELNPKYPIKEVSLYDIASKHGIPEEKKETSLIRVDLWAKGANVMKAQYDELLKGLVVSEEAIYSILYHLESDRKLTIKENHAKALANSTEIIKKGEK